MSTVRVLLSGGMDSALCLALAMDQGARPTAVFCEYGQRHRVMEAGAAALIAAEVSVPMVTVRGLDLGQGRLTGDEGGDLDAEGAVLPGRNRALLRAAAWAGGTRADEVWIGATADDQEVFEDCRRPYFDALEREWGITIHSPLVEMTKAQIVRSFEGRHQLLRYTYSCYQGWSLACGFCGACRARARGFAEAGVKDPGGYEDRRYLTPCGFCGAGVGDRCHHPSHGWTTPHREREQG